MGEGKVQVTKFQNIFIIRKDRDINFFTTGKDSIVISSFNFFALLKYLLFTNIISPKSLEGLLGEYYDTTRE